MKPEPLHLSDQELLLALDGELTAHRQKALDEHLSACWKCRARSQELETAIGDFVRSQREESEYQSSPIAGPRAMLKARLAQIPATQSAKSSWSAIDQRLAWGLMAATCCLLLLAFQIARSSGPGRKAARTVLVSAPDSRFTPGALILASRQAVCSQPNTKNKAVPVSLQRKVFEEYGISDAEPRAYEIDYLVTPALGGADDIRNLWPHSHSATVWNAEVKDALEDRLRDMVCDGQLDLAQAQSDIARDWIAAYKKYFHTETPLPQHNK